eukprot:scaffold142089_cov32-Tisochrysis_lutea.AAC.2
MGGGSVAAIGVGNARHHDARRGALQLLADNVRWVWRIKVHQLLLAVEARQHVYSEGDQDGNEEREGNCDEGQLRQRKDADDEGKLNQGIRADFAESHAGARVAGPAHLLLLHHKPEALPQLVA